VRNFFTKLNNMLNAIAYAEAGDFDAVKQILQAQSNHARVSEEKESTRVSGDTQELPVF
jgi:type I restriction-modification system DNA methylase subunit